jgi:methylphosphotriester-DNA--protein-cysteine methyltransferase
MIHHIQIGAKDIERRQIVRAMIRNGKIRFAGNKKLMIYGSLSCASGKRMKMENRVFFETEEQAIELGYRPCGHCMREKYLMWIRSRNEPKNVKWKM